MRLVVKLLALLLLLALLATGCGNDDNNGNADSATLTPPATATPTATSTPDPTPTSEPTPADPPEPTPDETLIEVTVVGGSPLGGVERHRVDVGETITLTVRGDAPDEVHVHGYDLFAPLTPQQPAVVTFEANIPGIFEVELEGSHTLLLELEVR